MKCQKCSAEFEGNFCPDCGCPVNGAPTPSQSAPTSSPQPPQNNRVSVRCPRCGCTDLQAVSDVSGKGASFWKLCFCGLLGLCGTGKTTTTHYWVCSKCGNKFKM